MNRLLKFDRIKQFLKDKTMFEIFEDYLDLSSIPKKSE